MLSDTLVTNEIKDAAGAEIEFQRLSISERATIFAKVDESPALPFRLSIAHTESGSGIKKRRRSVNRFDLTVVSDVDNLTPVTVSGYVVLDNPIGGLLTTASAKKVLAALMSFMASTGANTTILYDGSGNGASSLVNGTL